MINVRKAAFGKRLTSLMDGAGLQIPDIRDYLKLMSDKQVENYMAGTQFPSGNRIMELFVLFGIPLGELMGTQEWTTLLDRSAIHERLKNLT